MAHNPVPPYHIEMLDFENTHRALTEPARRLLAEAISIRPDVKTLNSATVFGAITDCQELAGIAVLHTGQRQPRFGDLDMTELRWLAVNHQYRRQDTQPKGFVSDTLYDTSYRQKGQGIGRALLGVVEEFSVQSGDQAIYLASRKESRGFYGHPSIGYTALGGDTELFVKRHEPINRGIA